MRWLVFSVAMVVGLAVSREAAASDAEVRFGQIDIGTSQVRYLNVSTANIDAQTLLGAQIIEGPNPWFTFAGPGCDGTSTCSFPTPIDLESGTRVIAFRCSPPATATGTRIAQVQLRGEPSDPAARPTLVCSARGGLLAVTPPSGTLDLGAVDLDRVPTTVTSIVTIENIGTASVTAGVGSLVGPDAARFTASPLAARTLNPGDVLAITVMYTPVAERTSTSPDTAQINIPLVGPIPVNSVSVQLRGHGIDRHASVQGVGTVPDTFVKPGRAAALIDVTIANTGEAPVGLSDASVTGAPVWAIDNPEAVDLPGGTTYAFQVRFAPEVEGAAPPTTFTVHTSDPDAPLLTASLAGNGKLRNVTMGPATIDLGYAGVDTTVHSSDPSRSGPLVLTNLDPATTFTVRSLVVLQSDQAFDVPVTAGTELAPGASLTFDVAFTPPHPGAFDATAVVRLDDDPDPAAMIDLHGEGLDVATLGGGGCSAGGEAGGGAGAGVVLVLVLALTRRRHRHRLVALGPPGPVVVVAVVAAAMLASAASASANPRDLDLAIFDPTPATDSSWFQLQGGDVGHDGDWAASALASYASRPLVLRTTTNDNVSIQDRMLFELGGAFAFGDRFELGLRAPLYVQSGENLSSATMFGEAGASGTAFGDLVVHAKANVLRARGPNGELAAGTSLALSLPTATDGQFAGSAKPQLAALALISLVPGGLGGRLALAAQAGVVLRATAQFHDLDQGNGMEWAAGASYSVRPALALDVELFGELIPNGLLAAPAAGETMGPAHVYDAIEGLVGLHYQMERRVSVGVAVGRGLTSAPGTPAFRGVLAVTFAPTAAPRVATRRISGDSDHDGVVDDLDRCPDQPEDRDGFQDDDGCPDPDNDGDGIADAKDRCPNEAEDQDGFEDDDGCPDPDNDHDGIPDRLDHCPDQPETINGVDDEDGCPDTGAALVVIAKDRLTLREPIGFTAGAKLAPDSFRVLGQIGATLRAHRELVKLRVSTRGTGRAQAVVDWLVQYGVEADRLEAQIGTSAAVEILIVDRTD